MKMLKISGVWSGYDVVSVLRGVSLRVGQGEIVSIIGANGAGKTTLMRTISGLLPVKQGKIEMEGEDISSLAAHRRANKGICLVPEGRQIFAEMTVMENLLIGAYSRRRQVKMKELESEIQVVFERFPILADRRRALGGTLSGGEQQMLAIGRALMAKPRAILLDEPSLGLAPLMVAEIFKAITELKDMGLGVLLVEQNARSALRISDHGYVLETGKIIMEGTGKMLADNEQVQAAYLGSKAFAS